MQSAGLVKGCTENNLATCRRTVLPRESADRGDVEARPKKDVDKPVLAL
jgi:hypothetical protein